MRVILIHEWPIDRESGSIARTPASYDNAALTSYWVWNWWNSQDLHNLAGCLPGLVNSELVPTVVVVGDAENISIS